MMDCPNCASELKKVIGKKKHEKIPVQRRYKGGIETSIYGDTRSRNDIARGIAAPVGAMKIDICISCKWTSIWRHDGPPIEISKGKTSAIWRLIESGVGLDYKSQLKKYGYR